MNLSFWLPLIAFSLLITPRAPANADTSRYRLTVLPLSFSGYTMVDDGYHRAGLNAQGQVVGMAAVRSDNQSDQRAAVWQRGRLQFLDKTPVKGPSDGTNQDFTSAAAINAHGDAVGEEVTTFSGAYSGWGSDGCAEFQGKWMGLRPFPAGSDSEAFGLNDHGDIVGDFGQHYDSHFESLQDPPTPASVFTHYAFVWHHGRVQKLWPGLARGINNKEEIIGTGKGGGLLWQSGKTTLLKMEPAAINEHTEMAGNVPITNDTGKACVWRRGKLTRLSAQISHAYALNNRGQVVGQIGDDALPGPLSATLWQNGRTYNLNRCVSLPKGWVLEKAIGINDHGWIIGEGSVYKTPKDKQALKSFTFLLTPK